MTETAKGQTEKVQQVEKTEEKPVVQTAEKRDAPVFKVQIVASSRRLVKGDAAFKGLDNISSYSEGGMYKYTYGASENYNEIYSLRKQILDKFPQAFIIAFKNGEKTDVNSAIREWKSNR